VPNLGTQAAATRKTGKIGAETAGEGDGEGVAAVVVEVAVVAVVAVVVAVDVEAVVGGAKGEAIDPNPVAPPRHRLLPPSEHPMCPTQPVLKAWTLQTARRTATVARRGEIRKRKAAEDEIGTGRGTDRNGHGGTGKETTSRRVGGNKRMESPCPKLPAKWV